MDTFWRVVMAIGRFLFGTRRAATATAIVALLILAYFNPTVIQTAIHNLIVAILNATLPIVSELLPLILVGLLIAFGFKTMFKGFKSSPAKKKKK